MAGSRSSIDVFLRLHGQRKFAKEVAASGAELEAMGLRGAKSMAAFAKSADKLKRFGKSWTHNVTLPVAGLGVVSGYMAANFKRQMGLVATDAGGTMKEVEGLERSVLSLAKETQYSPQELAESLFHVESAGYRGARAMKVLRESAKLATSGNSELEGTTYALVSAQKALNEGESLSGITKTAAQLNEIVAHGDIRLEELTAAMSTGLIPTAKALGLGVQDVGSALDIMTARGIPAQRAAYALNFTLQKLVPSTEKAEKVFGRLGLGSEQLLNVAQHKGLPWALEVLNKHMAGLTKGQKVQTIDEMFGGGRMSKGLLVVIQHLGEAKEKFHDINGDIQLYKKHVHEAEEQPLVKLKTAWSSIQAALVNIGGDLLPAAVPMLETLATDGEKIANAFLGLPGPVKAATLAFLVLTGPVASGLGYFASGVGRALILTAKLGRVAQNVGIFTQALRAGQGIKGSAGIGFSGFGQSAALQTAKGFAYSLGPAVAAYGIGNIVTSATSGDWEDAGWEAGGAMAGGIAGFLIGGPMGAMLGVGLGSLGGELFGGLFKGGSKLPTLQDKIATSSKGIKSALEGEAEASKRLLALQGRVSTARGREKTAAQELRTAEHHLEAVRSSAPAGSRAIAKAESNVAKAIEHVISAKRRAKKAERLKGEARAIAKEQFRYAALEERHRKHLLKNRIAELREQKQHAIGRGASLQELKPINDALVKNMDRLRTVNKQTNKTYEEAADKIGPKFAGFLKHASREAINLGSNLKVVAKRQREVNEESKAFMQARREGYSTIGEAEEGLPSFLRPRKPIPPVTPRRNSGPAGGPHQLRRSRNTTQRLNLRHPGALASALAGSTTPKGRGGDLTITVPVNLDGREIARNTAKVANTEALLQ